MPTAKNWIYFVYVNLGFAAYIAGTYYLNTIQDIKANWPMYRCNPIYMPLSDNIEKDFVYCIQNTQINFMGFLLEPITFITSALSDLMSGFLTEINFVRAMFNKIRDFFSTILESIFGVFLNIIIEFQKIIIGLKDLFGKTIGTVTTFFYVIDGSIKTMNSAWNGPPGQLVRVIGKCFHPDTKLKLQNGQIVMMKDINLGDILENGSIVQSTMKISNKDKNTHEDLYKLTGSGVNGEDILVTGSHLIYNKQHKYFHKVELLPDITISTISTDWFSCLITNDHKIKIGNELFWDWEDHFIKFPFVDKLQF
jgi:hypothetical protein